MGMIGDKRLEMPKSVKDVNARRMVYETFGIEGSDDATTNYLDACKLIELNNEVYDRQMKYKVIEDISGNDDGVGAKVGDILTVGWYTDKYGGNWALLKDGNYVCDLGSHCEMHNCTQKNPPIQETIAERKV
jgi:hypothetical protein